MLIARKIRGELHDFICSKCKRNLDKHIFDKKCPYCKSPIKPAEGDLAKCLGEIAWSCHQDCPHRKIHTKRTNSCKLHFCKYVGHFVNCTLVK